MQDSKTFKNQKSLRGSQSRSVYVNKKDAEFLEYKKQVNKLLLNEENVEKIEDARESKFYFEKMRCLDLCRLMLMIMAQSVAILDYEIEFNGTNDQYASWFLYITLVCSFMLIIMTYFSYEAKNQFIIATKTLGNQATIINTGEWKNMLIEMAVYVIFPMPWFKDIKVSFFVEFHQVTVYHYLNEIFLLIMMLRFLVMIKIILTNTKWYNERVNRICNLYATKMDFLFIVKVNMMQNPMMVFWFCYVFTLFIFSYAVRICERPLIRENDPDVTPQNFGYVETAIWCLLISIPSVGYGDRYPVTKHGRLIAAFAFICGTFMLSILCNSLEIILKLSSLEAKAMLVLRKLGVKQEIKELAVRMFVFIAKRTLRKRRGKGDSLLLNRKLRNTTSDFKSSVRFYKSLVDESNLSEQMDKQFSYMRDEIDSLSQNLKQVSDANKFVLNTVKQQQNSSYIENKQLRSHQKTGSLGMANSYQSMHTKMAVSINDPLVQQPPAERRELLHRQGVTSSVQYFTDDMDQVIKQKPYDFYYNMVNHVHPNQFY